MTSIETNKWYDANQRYLTAALAVVREALERHARRSNDAPETKAWDEGSQKILRAAADAMPAPPALETLCEMFGLSPFERKVLLLCAGMELDADFPALCAAAQGDARRTSPTFRLALAALPGAHWSALSPAGPLRYWRLIEVGSGDGLTLSPLRIDERALHYLTGMGYLDERLVGFVEPVTPLNPGCPQSLPRSIGDTGCLGAEPAPIYRGQPGFHLVPSHHALAERVATAWSQGAGKAPWPIVQLCGDERASQRAIAAAACAMLGLNLHAMSVQVIPIDPREQEALIRLWEREALLSASALLLDCGGMDTSDAAREHAITRLIEGMNSALIVVCRERRRARERPMVAFDVRKPTASEQRAIWGSTLGTATSNPEQIGVEVLVSQFNLSTQTIHAVCAEALGSVAAGDNGPTESPDDFGAVLWDVCRVQARLRLEDLAQRIELAARWDDLVLPEAQMQVLREVAVHVRGRTKVYETWGFAAKSSRGLGISALFAGPSGTGKTMAAEVLANELRLDLYRIDLSSVVSKYIGETEKNLRRVFDAAEEGGAILLFDEADALFGKRSEVKDSHDRYANIEISYLLQRMEAYRGLAILTTNMKNALDTAFLRRIRFIVQFPFPDAAQRAEIWRRVLPSDTPTDGLDVNKLARLNVAGGNIRNIALYAAFLAAEAGEPVRMSHLLRAARVEYAKLEKSLTDSEIGGWV